MLDNGPPTTSSRSRRCWARVGARLGFSVGSTHCPFGSQPSRDLPLLVSLLAEQLREPAIPGARFAKLEASRSTVDARADAGPTSGPTTHCRARCSPGHRTTARPRALRPTSNGRRWTIWRSIRELLRAHRHADRRGRRRGPRGHRRCAGHLAAGGRFSLPPPPTPPLSDAEPFAVDMPDKTSVTVVIGQPTGLRYADADTLPLWPRRRGSSAAASPAADEQRARHGKA